MVVRILIAGFASFVAGLSYLTGLGRLMTGLLLGFGAFSSFFLFFSTCKFNLRKSRQLGIVVAISVGLYLNMSNNKKQQKMEFTIENKLSKSGKRKMLFPTINGKRLTKINLINVFPTVFIFSICYYFLSRFRNK